MSNVMLEAEIRSVKGKGASRRLRRLDQKVPAVLYGGDKEPVMLHLQHNKVIKALETESIYSSVFDLSVGGKNERVILKDLQRHPYKPVILHMDLQRVSAKDILVKMIPLHFINEDTAPGVKNGGMVNHSMMQVEVRCQAQHLPEFIEVDLSQMEIDDVLHLSDLKLAKGVNLAVDLKQEGHDHPVVSIHVNRASLAEELETEEEAGAASDIVEATDDDSAEEDAE